MADLELETVGLTGQPRQGGEKYDLALDGPFSAFFGQGLYVNIIVLVSAMLISFFWNLKGASILSWSFSGISVACLVVSSSLHWAFTCDCIQNVTVRCWVAYLSVFLRMVAATFLLLFLDPARHLVVILPLSLLVLVLLCSFFVLQKRHTNQDKCLAAGKYWREHEAELKLGFDVSSQVTTLAFAGLLGTVIGYVKDSSSNQLRLSRRGYMPPDCFLSYSILLGLLVQLLSTVTPYIEARNFRKRMAKVYLRMVAYASLMFLVLASVMAAEEILQEWVFIACFVIVIIPVLFFWLDYRNGPDWFKDENNGLPTSTREQDDDKFDKDAQQIILGFITPLFAALMAGNSKYGGSAVSLSGWFKCSVLLELYGVLSYAVRMVVFSEMPEMKSFAFPKMVWILSSIATIAITIILLVVVGRLHPDEIKNLF